MLLIASIEVLLLILVFTYCLLKVMMRFIIKKAYASLVGNLYSATNCIRASIAYAARVFSKFTSKPSNWKEL